jgi:H/ACA ribonucleoprotein complex subunit 4
MDINLQKIQQEKPIQELIEFGIINVNKPSHITSFGVVDRIRKIFDIKRVGHFGTLDLKVTGVLPIALGRACKLCEYFMHHDKEYVGKFRVHSEISEDDLKNEMKRFVGKIMQKPPVKSAVKRVERPRTVNKFELIKKNERVVDFHTDVEAGTYVRKLISDLGEKEIVGGAHMIELKRIRAGIFKQDKMHTLEEINDAFKLWKEKEDESKLREIIIPAEIISEILPFYEIKHDENDSFIKQILNGVSIKKQDFVEEPKQDLFAVFLKDKFLGIYEKDTEENSNKFKAKFVLN